MSDYAQYDPRIVCLDCSFVTYSVESAERHEHLKKHQAVDEDDL